MIADVHVIDAACAQGALNGIGADQKHKKNQDVFVLDYQTWTGRGLRRDCLLMWGLAIGIGLVGTSSKLCSWFR